MKKIKFGLNYAVVVLAIGIIAIAPFYVIIFILEQSWAAIFPKKEAKNEEKTLDN